MANENWSPGKGQQIPNGPIKTQPYLTTITPDNPDGYVKLVPNAPSTNPLFKLEYAVQTGNAPGVVSLRVIDDQGNVRRQFSSFQELADSGYNFGFDINSESINGLKTQLSSELTNSSNDILSGAVSPSPYFTGTLPPPSQGEQPTPIQPGAPGDGGGSAPSSGVGNTTFDVSGASPLTDLISQFDDKTNSFGGIKEFLYYPSNIRESGQDRITITQIEYVPGNVTNALTGSLGSRESDFNSSKVNTLGMVVLPIPNELSEANQTSWGEDSLSSISAALMGKSANLVTNIASGNAQGTLGTLKDITNAVGNGAISNRLKQFLTVNAAASVLKLGGINVNPEAYISRVTGTAINPNLELLFNGPKLRQFGFQFKLTPRDEKEARNIRSIIKFFKKGMAPRRSTKEELSIFLGAPNVFRIKFKSGETNNELDSVGKIKTCALTSFNANYTPDGFYAAYKDPNAGGSQPIAVVINLGFAELTPIFNDEYDGNSPSVGPEFVQENAKSFNVEGPNYIQGAIQGPTPNGGTLDEANRQQQVDRIRQQALIQAGSTTPNIPGSAL